MSVIATAQIIAAQYVSEQKNVKLGFPCIPCSVQYYNTVLYCTGFPCITAGAVCSTGTVWMDKEDHIASRL